MILLAHIAVALISVIFATLLYFSPTDFKFKANYALLTATLMSGTYLVVDRGTHIMESCLMGLAYIGAVAFALISAKKKFVKQDQSSER